MTDLERELEALRPYVYQQATMLVRRLPASIELDDLRQAGMIAAWQCLQTFDPTEGAKVTTFARPRIVGAMIDYLRESDPLGRRTRVKVKLLQHVDVPDLDGHVPGAAEVAVTLGVTEAEVWRLRRDATLGRAIGNSDDVEQQMLQYPAPDTYEPENIMNRAQRELIVIEELDRLPEGLRYIVEARAAGRSVGDLGKELGVSGSRVSQIFQQALRLLQASVKARLQDAPPASVPKVEAPPLPPLLPACLREPQPLTLEDLFHPDIVRGCDSSLLHST